MGNWYQVWYDDIIEWHANVNIFHLCNETNKKNWVSKQATKNKNYAKQKGFARNVKSIRINKR